jgi:hypothetical protein
VRRSGAILVAALAAALAAAAHAAAVDFGATDDTGKYLGADSAPYFAAMAGTGLSVNVMTLTYDGTRRIESSETAAMDKALPIARRHGVTVALRLFPAAPTLIGTDPAAARRFGEWAAQIARRYPSVRTFVIGNEPNQPRFWQPQFDAAGRQVSAAGAGRMLAAAYDALKRVDPSLTVVGLGVSSRGNDRPRARNNVSTSPVRFIAALGAWYRASKRPRPLMDAFSFHPYPNSYLEPLVKGFQWPNAGVVDLDRLKIALHDAFRGTAQRTPANGLPIVLNEVGWQVDTSRSTAYTGNERVPVTSEEHQAAVYAEIVRRASCDPGVSGVSFFAFFDQREREGWQSGLFRVDGSPRAAAGRVAKAIGLGDRGCRARERQRLAQGWKPPRGVVGAKAFFSGWARNCRGAQGAKRLCLTAAENARYRAAAFPAGTPRAEMERVLRRGGTVRGALAAYGRPSITLAPRADGPSVIAVRVWAQLNPSRSSLFVGPVVP